MVELRKNTLRGRGKEIQGGREMLKEKGIQPRDLF